MIAFILLALYAAILALKCILALLVLRRQKPRHPGTLEPSETSQITIAQPILSGDPELPNVLRRQLEALPIEIEFLWLIDELDAEGQRIGIALAEHFPRVTIDLCPQCASDQNPKTFKLQRALQKTQRRWLVVLDDDTEIGIESLAAALDALERSQLYTGLPTYRVPAGWWGRLLAHFVNSQSILTYLPPLTLFPPMSLNGMFYAFEAEKLRSIEGFEPIMTELCDDYALHRHVTSHGWSVVQGITFQNVSTSVNSFSEYWKMMHRWMVFGLLLARDQSLARQAYLVAMLSLPPILLLAAIPFALTNVISAIALATALVARHMMLVAMQRAAAMPRVPFGFVLSILSELLQPLQTLSAMFNSSIVWRGRRIRIREGLRFETTHSS